MKNDDTKNENKLHYQTMNLKNLRFFILVILIIILGFTFIIIRIRQNINRIINFQKSQKRNQNEFKDEQYLLKILQQEFDFKLNKYKKDLEEQIYTNNKEFELKINKFKNDFKTKMTDDINKIFEDILKEIQ